MAAGTLYITGDADADRLLNTDGFALLVGMLLDQQVPMEWAFRGPATLKERLGHLDANKIAGLSEDEVVAVATAKPAIHRFPAVMARRLYALASFISDRYDGDASRIWSTASDGAELYRRLRELPGFGDEKAKIFVALLAKREGVRPPGWEQAAGVFADATPRSVADCRSAESLAQVRQWKQAQKAARKDKQDRPLKPAPAKAKAKAKAI
jgi:uncharacterized HhH-GPD family protein